MGDKDRSLLRGGTMKTVTPDAPDAGEDVEVEVPSGKEWVVRALRAKLTTDANDGNRPVHVEIVTADDDVAFQSPPAGTVQVKSEAYEYNVFATGAHFSAEAVGDQQYMATPPLRLVAGMILRTVTGGIKAGDQWSDVVLLVEEWQA